MQRRASNVVCHGILAGDEDELVPMSIVPNLFRNNLESKAAPAISLILEARALGDTKERQTCWSNPRRVANFAPQSIRIYTEDALPRVCGPVVAWAF